MRIFVSSSFEDLRAHRAAAIRVLRQLGHEVLAMEDMVAGPEAPLPKVIEMVDRAEAYVGIFAWRYGYLPQPEPGRPLPDVAGAVPGATSITHYEYLRARERDIPVIAFLLEEAAPWPPAMIDGVPMDAAAPDPPVAPEPIRELRRALAREKVISWFREPADLEARVAAAVTMAGLSSQIDVEPAVSVGMGAGFGAVEDSGGMSIAVAVGAAGLDQRVFRVDLGEPWWSTRLFLLAALAERLTGVRRILVVRTPPGAEPGHAEFVGQVGTRTVLATMRGTLPQFARFERAVERRRAAAGTPQAVADDWLRSCWAPAFGGSGASPQESNAAEEAVKDDLTPDLLRRWFGDAMLQGAVEIADLARVSVVDLLRLVDYPSQDIPVVSGRGPRGDGAPGRVDVLDKAALNARLARSYLTELRERARIL
jgi:hypothetical protein